jgi:hypothetical protein
MPLKGAVADLLEKEVTVACWSADMESSAYRVPTSIRWRVFSPPW